MRRVLAAAAVAVALILALALRPRADEPAPPVRRRAPRTRPHVPHVRGRRLSRYGWRG